MTEPTIPPGVAAAKPTIQSASTSSGVPDALASQAETLLIAGRLEEAEAAIHSALKHPKWQYFLILGRIWSAQNRQFDAEQAFRHAVSLEIMAAPTHWRLSELLLKKGALEEAEKEARHAINLHSGASVYHSTLGAVLLAQGRLDEAHSSLRRAIRLNRKNPGPRVLLAQLMAAKGNYRRAEKILAKARAMAPKSLSVLGSLRKIFDEQGKIDEAVACTKRILDLEPNNARIHIQLSNQYRKAGRLEEAEHAMRAALGLQPIPANYASLSHILAARSRMTEAISAMSEARRLDPENKAYRGRLAKLTADAGAVARPSNRSAKPASVQQSLPTPRPTLLARLRIFARSKKMD